MFPRLGMKYKYNMVWPRKHFVKFQKPRGRLSL